MDFEKEIVQYLNSHPFSIEMLDECRLFFQHAEFGKREEIIFTDIMIHKVQEFFPGLPKDIGKIFAQLCIDRGILKIKDILFMGDAIMVERESDILVEKEYPSLEKILHIDFIGSLGRFKSCSSADFIDAFTDNFVPAQKSEKFAQALHNIFYQYYDCPCFPSVLNWHEMEGLCPFIRFAINVDETEICKAFLENKPIHFTIINQVGLTDKCVLLGISFSPEKENLLEIVNVKEDYDIRLSNTIQKREKCVEKVFFKGKNKSTL